MSRTSRSSRSIGSALLFRATSAQWRKGLRRDSTMEADVRLDCRSAQMAVENCLRRLKLDALVLAVQQLAQTLHGARGQLAQRSLDHLGDSGPAARIGAAARQPVSAIVAFQDEA